MVKNSR